MEVVVKDVNLSALDTVLVEYITYAYNPIDTDGDFLTNHFENLIGTCIDDADTDEDGFSDHAELTNGENPKTNIGIQTIPSMILIETAEGETIQDTIQITNLLNCTGTFPIIEIYLHEEDTMLAIIDTIGIMEECPYLITENGMFTWK